MQRADQFHEQMCAGGNGDDFRLGLAGVVRVREKHALLRPAPARKNEEATGQQQKAVLIDVFHERIVTPSEREESQACDTSASATLTKEPDCTQVRTCFRSPQFRPARRAHGLQVCGARASRTARSVRGMCFGTSKMATCDTLSAPRYEMRK